MKEGRTQTILGKRQPRKEGRKEATEEKGQERMKERKDMRREETKNVISFFVSCFSITCENNYGRPALRAPPPGPPKFPLPIQACTGVKWCKYITQYY